MPLCIRLVVPTNVTVNLHVPHHHQGVSPDVALTSKTPRQSPAAKHQRPATVVKDRDVPLTPQTLVKHGRNRYRIRIGDGPRDVQTRNQARAIHRLMLRAVEVRRERDNCVLTVQL